MHGADLKEAGLSDVTRPAGVAHDETIRCGLALCRHRECPAARIRTLTEPAEKLVIVRRLDGSGLLHHLGGDHAADRLATGANSAAATTSAATPIAQPTLVAQLQRLGQTVAPPSSAMLRFASSARFVRCGACGRLVVTGAAHTQAVGGVRTGRFPTPREPPVAAWYGSGTRRSPTEGDAQAGGRWFDRGWLRRRSTGKPENLASRPAAQGYLPGDSRRPTGRYHRDAAGQGWTRRGCRDGCQHDHRAPELGACAPPGPVPRGQVVRRWPAEASIRQRPQ